MAERRTTRGGRARRGSRATRAGAGRRGPAFRVGIGIDRHPFDPARTLVLGGVVIPGSPGLAGHSDADAVLHALSDAIAGAIGQPDIGTRFPGGDPRWRDAPSARFLEAVLGDLRASGYAIGNVDLVVLAEMPPLAPHLEAVRAAIAALLGVPAERVGVKAKRGERLGFVGKRLGIEVHAVALVEAMARPDRGAVPGRATRRRTPRRGRPRAAGRRR